MANNNALRGLAEGAHEFTGHGTALRIAYLDGYYVAADELELRHYRNGLIAASIRLWSWHQNTGYRSTCSGASSILGAQSVEYVIGALKAIRLGNQHGDGTPAYSDYAQDQLTAALTALGMPIVAPAPNEVLA